MPDGPKGEKRSADVIGRKGPWWEGPGPNQGFTLKVTRTGRPPLPWTWEIVSEDGRAGVRRSLRAYQSAEDAWAAGRAAFADLQGGGDPTR
jgi:hypothetical protein